MSALHRVAKKLADGTWAAYAYDRRGGKLVRKVYGYTRDECWAKLRDTGQTDKRYVASAVRAYQDSQDFKWLTPSTQDAYTRYLARFTEAFGQDQLETFEHYQIREVLTDWREDYADKPRGADYMMRAVGAFFKWARGRGLTNAEPIRGIKSLHRSNRSDLIWARRDFRAIRPHCTPALYRAIRLAGETGLRRADLIGLRWDQIDADTIQLITRKTAGVAVIPLTRSAKFILSRIDREGDFVLKGARGRPWTGSGLATEFQKAKRASGVALRFHDLRGTAATRFRSLGYTNEEIARAMGWTVGAVEMLMTRYVKNADVMRAAINRVSLSRTNRRQTKQTGTTNDQ